MQKHTPSVILIEDDDATAAYVQYRLVRLGVEVAWRKTLDAHLPAADLVLLDLNVPPTSMMETVKRFKALHPDRMFAVLTAVDDVAMLSGCIDEGALRVIVEAHMDALEASIVDVLAHAEMLRTLLDAKHKWTYRPLTLVP